MLIRMLGGVLLGALALLGSPAYAAPDDGVVEGWVTNGTAGGRPAAGDRVSLLSFDVAAQAPLGERGATVAPDGSFVFEGVDRDANLAYLVIVEHDAVGYPAATPFQLKDAARVRSEVRVFDATASDDMLRFERVNLMVMGAEPGLLQVFQMGAVSNAGDRTYVTPNPQEGRLARAVRFGLPANALQARFQAGFRDADVLEAVGGIQVAAPLKPGRHEYALSFLVPYTGSEADLSLQLPYPAAAFTVYAPDGGPRLASSLLTPGGRSDQGGQTFLLYSASDLSKGTVVPARLGSLAWGGGVGVEPNQLAALSLAAVLLVIGGGVLVLGRRVPRSKPDVVERPSAHEEERLQLVVRLALLDERYAAGELSADDYQLTRGREKTRLLELARAHSLAPSGGPGPGA